MAMLKLEVMLLTKIALSCTWLSQACSKQCSLPPYTMNPENGAQGLSPVRARKGYVCLGVFGVCMPEDRKG